MVTSVPKKSGCARGAAMCRQSIQRASAAGSGAFRRNVSLECGLERCAQVAVQARQTCQPLDRDAATRNARLDHESRRLLAKGTGRKSDAIARPRADTGRDANQRIDRIDVEIVRAGA